jgi:hypothetical protein
MEKFKYNDGMKSGWRHPILYLTKGEKCFVFKGKDIKDFCVIAAAVDEKNGKWSNTDYTLLLAPGVRPLYFLSPLHGTWGDSLESWGQAIEELGVSLDLTKRIIRNGYPDTAERFDKVDDFALLAEQEDCHTEVINFSFGSPNNRAYRDQNYWKTEKVHTTWEGLKVVIKPDPNPEIEWKKPILVSHPNGKILSSEHTPGKNGGYRNIKIIINIPTLSP